MFQFPGFASTPYAFRCRYRRSGGFPHSDIPGSKPVCRLPEAFRRLPRPSSPVVAKASTVCAYSLDHITPNTLRRSIKCANATRSDCFQRFARLRSAPTLRFPIVKEHRAKNHSSIHPRISGAYSAVISCNTHNHLVEPGGIEPPTPCFASRGSAVRSRLAPPEGLRLGQ